MIRSSRVNDGLSFLLDLFDFRSLWFLEFLGFDLLHRCLDRCQRLSQWARTVCADLLRFNVILIGSISFHGL